MDILRKANNLNDTNIGIDKDFTKEVQEERRRLVPFLREAKEKGPKAVLRYNKLINYHIWGNATMQTNNKARRT